MAYNVPSLDNSPVSAWTPQDIKLYNSLPYYFVRKDLGARKSWQTWSPLFRSIPWKPNMGQTMRNIMVEYSPIARQTAFPNPLTTIPKRDITTVKERKADALIGWQDFYTPQLNFYPSFVDFMAGNIAPQRENISRQMLAYEEAFYRTQILMRSPYVYVAGVGMVTAPTGTYDSNGPLGSVDGTKNKNWFLTQINSPNLSHLSIAEVGKALVHAEEDVGMEPFEGSGLQRNKSDALDARYVLNTQPITWNQFTDDPWLRENRQLQRDIVTDRFHGDLFGRIRTSFEKYGFRFKTTDDMSDMTMPAPEISVGDDNQGLLNETVLSPDYALRTNIGISWLVGGVSYETVDTGAPPAPFAKGGVPAGFAQMQWNGEIYMNKNFLVQVGLDANNNPVYETNDQGRWIRLQSTLTVGINPIKTRNILPIIHKLRGPQYFSTVPQ